MVNQEKPRIEWVDYVKGLTIILVVQLHVTHGIEAAMGLETHSAMGAASEFFKSFRMPLFFLVAGLFLSRTIQKSWLQYLDSKLIHFMYFYILWTLIEFTIKASLATFSAHEFPLGKLLQAVYQPFSSLWFIYMLAVFFIVTRLLKNVHMPILLTAASLLFLWQPQTGLVLIDEFAHRYVFFLFGYAGSQLVFNWAHYTGERILLTLAVFTGFALINLVALYKGLPSTHILAMAISIAGIGATIAVCAVLARKNIARFLPFIGKHSLYIYLSFFVPAAILRVGLVKLDMAPEVNLFALLTTVVAVILPVLVYHLIRKSPLAFVYVRPDWMKLGYDSPQNADATQKYRQTYQP